MKNKLLVTIVILLFFIVGGTTYFIYNGKNLSGSNKPNDVSQEVWDRVIQYTLYVNKITKEGGLVPDGLADELNSLAESKGDKELIIDFHLLVISSLLYKIQGDSEYPEIYKALAEKLGSDLKRTKLNLALIESYIADNVNSAAAKMVTQEQEFLSSQGVNLTAKEVQYNMKNNLDKKFFINGSVELCDYYNYGFTNESAYFCGHITPIDGSYSDSWYLYFHRDSFNVLYDAMLRGEVNMMIIAEIPSSVYKNNQGNMARVLSTKYY
ncbi:hypothetical protein [Metasolibacillus meyeri]|uniref:hypothetical protein n=1 Tax=Metasolibacillus meyeri TaxID=1071052 RepID=UPI000D2FF564|nr:hypothetical protein [Metasolibacillus meyeri]